jgi:carboxyl-terminal processing protease
MNLRFRRFQRFLITFLVAIGFFYGGYYMGKRGFIFEVRKNPPKIEVINQYPADGEIDFELFWEVWDLVGDTYLDRPVDTEEMMYGAIFGMVQSLGDPYTSFLKPTINESVGDALGGRYQGIGAELGMKDNQLIIVAPFDGSPAKESGVLSGDKILKIEDEGTIGITVTEAVSKIRGPAGTRIRLTLQQNDDDPREVTITRGVIKVSSVTWEDKGDGTAYIRVSRFGTETNTEWSEVVAKVNINMRELDVIVLDLRGNPGGYLESSVFLAEEFFTNKPVLYEETATGEQIPFEAKRLGTFHNVPGVIVLVDEGSASASEILAAALRENIDATIIGANTFGKGTIQEAKDFDDGSGVHITIAKWLTSDKKWVHETGIEPDIIIELTDEDREEGRDPQLDKALELAKEI